MPPIDHQIAPPARSRTPPDLKFLLNEQARLRGDLSAASKRKAVLLERAARYSTKLANAQAELTKLQAHEAVSAANLEALQQTVQLLHAAVDPEAGGTVHAWAGKYGERGAMKAFVREYLRSVAPLAVGTSDVTRAVAKHFGLELVTPHDRWRQNQTMRTTLREVHAREGCIERIETWQGRLCQPKWRWKAATTMADIQRAVAEQSAS